MPELPVRSAALFACGVYLGVGSNGTMVTIEQRDPLRSARASRTVDVSASGRYVAFESWAQLVPADVDQRPDIYVLDRETGRVTLESDGLGDAEHSHPRISGDGGLLVFEARAVDPDYIPRVDIVLRDRTASTTRLLTTLISRPVSGWSRDPDISDDGRVVAFSSASTTLVDGPDANGASEDVYVLQVATGAIERISVTDLGMQVAKGSSIQPVLSADGRWVAFGSTAPLDAAPGPGQEVELPMRQVFVRDRVAHTTTRISRTSRGGRPNGDSSLASISGDGRYVAFASDATNITADDRNRGSDVFVCDRQTGVTTHVSHGTDGAPAAGTSTNPVISSDGRFIVFQSDDANLVCASRCPQGQEDINLLWDIFVFDRTTTKIVRVSEDELGGWMEWSAGPAIDGSGDVVAFSSRHPVDEFDRRQDLDLFVRRARK
jgi:Tol biopolymer transport system component